ncbi:uncharacterized protein LOC121380379 [Gigantopelta aegis]|uniref:uncharacterized protein LOC121380379 n=1 Tax=Gigantopelta aegis TaxID=1735272 RepID=UPI001B88A674|nr:uncharacterized protein LOC121380379 [Gigantopelta aegis]
MTIDDVILLFVTSQEKMSGVNRDTSEDKDDQSYREVDIIIVGGSFLLIIIFIVIWLLCKMSQEKDEHIEQDRTKHEHICWHGFLQKLQDHYRQKHEDELIRIRLKDCSSYSVIPKSSTSQIQLKTVQCEEYDANTPLCRAVSVETIKEFPARRNISRSLGATMNLFKHGQYSKYTFPPDNDRNKSVSKE